MSTDGSAENTSRTWRTVKVQLLDSKDLINKLSESIKGAAPGTNEEYDLHAVGNDLLEMLLVELKDSNGVHASTGFAAMGALAGFSAQMAVREALIKSGQLTEETAFGVARTQTGEKYLTSDFVNIILFGKTYSIYEAAVYAARKSGATSFPDLEEVFSHVVTTIGTDKFGIPRVATEYLPKRPAIELLDKFWNPIRNFLVVNVTSPADWPKMLGLVMAKFIVMSKAAADPAVAAKIVVETAVAMSKIDPTRIHCAHFQSY